MALIALDARGSGGRGQPPAARRGRARSGAAGLRAGGGGERPVGRPNAASSSWFARRTSRTGSSDIRSGPRELFEDATGGEAGSPELRLESLRRLEEIYDALGNKAKRLNALERLAAVEPKPGGKRFIWALAAELAVELGDVDRAIGAWQARLALDPADVDALAAARDLLVRSERWPAVIDLLRRRIDSAPPAYQIRADLIEIATLARERLEDTGRAIEIWREVVTRFGDDDESVGALADLYAESRAFAELAELLSRNANVDRGHHADRLARLADAHRLELGDAAAAVEWYGRALDVDPAHEGRAGRAAGAARGRIDRSTHARGPAARGRRREDRLLAAAARSRSAAAGGRVRSAGERARILEDAAVCAETRAGDHKRALAWLCEALPLAGTSARLEQRGAASGGGDRRLRRPGAGHRRDHRRRRRAAADARPPARTAGQLARGARGRSRGGQPRATPPPWRSRPSGSSRDAAWCGPSSGWAGSPRPPACSSTRRRRPMRATRC